MAGPASRGIPSACAGQLPSQHRASYPPAGCRCLTEADCRYLHETHGLPPELVTDVLTSMAAE